MRWLLLCMSCLLSHCGDVARSEQQDQSEQHEVIATPSLCAVLQNDFTSVLQDFYKAELGYHQDGLIGLWFRHGFGIVHAVYSCGVGCGRPACDED